MYLKQYTYYPISFHIRMSSKYHFLKIFHYYLIKLAQGIALLSLCRHAYSVLLRLVYTHRTNEKQNVIVLWFKCLYIHSAKFGTFI